MNITRRQFLVKAGKVSIFAISAPLIPFICKSNPVSARQEFVPQKTGIRYIHMYSVEEDEVIRRFDVLLPATTKTEPKQYHVAWYWHKQSEQMDAEIIITALCHKLELSTKAKQTIRELMKRGSDHALLVVYKSDRGFAFV